MLKHSHAGLKYLTNQMKPFTHLIDPFMWLTNRTEPFDFRCPPSKWTRVHLVYNLTFKWLLQWNGNDLLVIFVLLFVNISQIYFSLEYWWLISHIASFSLIVQSCRLRSLSFVLSIFSPQSTHLLSNFEKVRLQFEVIYGLTNYENC